MKEFFLDRKIKKVLRAFRRGEFLKAEQGLESVRRKNSERRRVSWYLGAVKLALGKFDEAEELLLDDRRRNGESLESSKVLGDLYYIWGKPERAKESYASAREMADDQDTLAFLGKRIRNCSSRDNYENVSNSFRRFEEGLKRQQKGEWEEALNLFSQAAELDPTNFHALNNRGTILLNRQKDYHNAFNCFDQAWRYSKDPTIQENRKLCQNLLNQNG